MRIANLETVEKHHICYSFFHSSSSIVQEQCNILSLLRLMASITTEGLCKPIQINPWRLRLSTIVQNNAHVCTFHRTLVHSTGHSQIEYMPYIFVLSTVVHRQKEPSLFRGVHFCGVTVQKGLIVDWDCSNFMAGDHMSTWTTIVHTTIAHCTDNHCKYTNC